MALASTKTLLPLDRFARIAGINPLHFSQVVVDGVAPPGTCADPLLQYDWQESDRTGRETIAQAIADVETRLSDYLNFAPRPMYYTDKSIQYIKPRNPTSWFSSFTDARGQNRALDLGAGYAISGGQETKSLVEAAVTITYSDSDMDGYFETATVVTTTDADALGNTVTNGLDIGVYYPGQQGADAWEIRPVAVSIDSVGGTITCVFRREQAVLPELMFGLQSTGVDGLEDANFLEEVDVYHKFLDPSKTQVEFRYEQPCVVSSFAIQNGSMLIRDSKLGWASLTPSRWDVTLQAYVRDCLSYCGMPDNLRVWYYAGYPLDAQGNMDPMWERAIAYLALAELDRPICQCATLATFTSHWSFDMATSTTDSSHRISNRHLECPLGTTRAALFVWDLIQRHRLPDKV